VKDIGAAEHAIIPARVEDPLHQAAHRQRADVPVFRRLEPELCAPAADLIPREPQNLALPPGCEHTAKLKSPVGMPDKAELALRVVLPRAVIERLMARAHRENYPSLAAWVQAVLEGEGKGW
jgi:hypothetical protein